MSVDVFQRRGWLKFPYDPQVLQWLDHARAPALSVAADRGWQKDWLRCDGTWFVGVNALPNDAGGRVGGSAPLGGVAVDFIRNELELGAFDWDKGQVSVIYPGYPRQTDGESAVSFEFRQKRDAAHVDGFHPVGPDRRRQVLEFQGFLLGLPMVKTDAGASPLVVWEGSHQIIGKALRAALADHPSQDWPDVDLTEVYHTARKEVLERCSRIEVHAQPGECTLMHPHMLHGVVPWRDGVKAPSEGRVILYFRPEIDRQIWLNAL